MLSRGGGAAANRNAAPWRDAEAAGAGKTFAERSRNPPAAAAAAAAFRDVEKRDRAALS